MNQFSYLKNKSQEIFHWPQILEFSKKRIHTVLLNSFVVNENVGFRFIYIVDGKFNWTIDGKEYAIFPNDVVIIKPNQNFGSTKGSFEIGSFISISFDLNPKESFKLGNWSRISESEQELIWKIIAKKGHPIISNFKKFGEILGRIENEIVHNSICYKSLLNILLDELWIQTIRQINTKNLEGRIFPETFHNLDKLLRENLSHPWTVDEMAVIIGLGTTTFTEKFKAFSGFAPLNYLINLRISESIKLLKNTDKSLTDIALSTGFYSSQHFSTTFKKLTGYTPGLIRKNK